MVAACLTAAIIGFIVGWAWSEWSDK